MNLRVLMSGFELPFWALLCEEVAIGLLDTFDTTAPTIWSPKEAMELADTCQSTLEESWLDHEVERLNRAWPWKQGCPGRPKNVMCFKCFVTTTYAWY